MHFSYALYVACTAGTLRASLAQNIEQLEQQRLHCARSKSSKPARRAGDLNATFVPLLEGGAFAELSPKILSTDPWIVYFDKFMTEAEASAAEAHMFSQPFHSSQAGASQVMQLRHSESAFCHPGPCDDHEIVRTLHTRASKIVGAPEENFDFFQALRYKKGMYYREHHDNRPGFSFLPCGARLFTYFLYVSDAGLQGGDTYFPKLNITAPAKRGAAVLFVDTLDQNPMRTDPRTLHESLTVTKGEKRGINVWVHQYNFRHFWHRRCTHAELGDSLIFLGKAAAKVVPSIVFQNNANRDLHVFHLPDQHYHPGERYLTAIQPGSSVTIQSAEGEILLVRSQQTGGKLLKEHHVLATAVQRLNLGKKKPVEL